MNCKNQSRTVEKEILIIDVANYVVDEKATVRNTAEKFQIPKTTIHNYLTNVLPILDYKLARAVRNVLDYNTEERYSRGGKALKMKCSKCH